MIGSQTIQVCAGDINAEEARLLDYVNRTFEQDGLSYKVNEAYKTKLRNKLMQDDIDLTSGDIELIVGEIDNNVATGVENGYLVLTEEEEQEPSKVPDTEESSAGGEHLHKEEKERMAVKQKRTVKKRKQRQRQIKTKKQRIRVQ